MRKQCKWTKDKDNAGMFKTECGRVNDDWQISHYDRDTYIYHRENGDELCAWCGSFDPRNCDCDLPPDGAETCADCGGEIIKTEQSPTPTEVTT